MSFIDLKFAVESHEKGFPVPGKPPNRRVASRRRASIHLYGIPTTRPGECSLLGIEDQHRSCSDILIPRVIE
jgi:hypothetical protein